MDLRGVLHTLVDHVEQLSQRVLSGASPAAELHAAIDEHFGANQPDPASGPATDTPAAEPAETPPASGQEAPPA